MALLHILWFASVLGSLGRQRLREGLPWFALAAVWGGWVVFVWTPQPGLFVPVHEVWDGHALRALYGLPSHTGPLYRWFWRETLAEPGVGGSVTATLRCGWLLTGWSLLGASAMLWRWSRPRWLGALVVLACVPTVAVRLAASGNSEAALAWPYLLGVVPGFLAARDRRWPGLLALTAGTVLLGLVRLELSGVGLSALAAALLLAHGSGARLEAWWERCLAPGRRLDTLGLLVVGSIVVGLALPMLPLVKQLVWLRHGLQPLHLGQFVGPLLALGYLPPAVVVLAVVGIGRAVHRPLSTGGLLVSLQVLWGAYFAAGHGLRAPGELGAGSLELMRYGLLLVPLVWVAAGLALVRLSSRSSVLVAAALFVGPWPGVVAYLPVLPADREQAPLWPAWGVLDRDLQRSYGAFLAVHEEEPDCTLLTWTAPWGGESSSGELVALVPRQGRLLVRSRSIGAPLEELLADDPCALWLESPDCERGDCSRWRPEGPVIWERTWSAAPAVHPHHGPQLTGELGVRAWRLR